MFARTLSLLAMTALVAAAAVTQAAAGSCCGCAYGCAPPQVQIWGLSPTYVVNQGPVYTGPGFYTAPIYEGEVSTADYPYVGYGDYPRYRPRHFEMLHRHEGRVFYRRGFGPHSLLMSGEGHWASRGHRDFRDPRD